MANFKFQLLFADVTHISLHH